MVLTVTVPVVVRRRSLWKRVLRFPFTWRSHYRVMRRAGAGRVNGLHGAWILAGLTIKVGR